MLVADPILIISIFIPGYLAFFLFSRSARIHHWFGSRIPGDRGEILWILAQRLLMVLFAGIIPGTVLVLQNDGSLAGFGLRITGSPAAALWIVGLSVALAVVSYLTPKKDADIAAYPQLRVHRWTPGLIAFNTLTWGGYLFAYELMFRGFLLQALLTWGPWIAVAVNTAIYVAVHIPKGRFEAVGALLLGPILCAATIRTGTIWVAFLSHFVLALTNWHACLRANPEMSIGLREKSTETGPELT